MASPHNTHDADLMRMMNRDNYLMFSCCETDGGGDAFHRDDANNMNEDDDDGCDDEVREFITSDEFLRAITDADVLDAEAAFATPRTTATAAASSTRQQPEPEEEEPVRFSLHLNEDEPAEYYNKNSNNKNHPKRLKQSRGRKNKKNKLWSLPKRPISSYNYFFQQERPKVMADYPDCAFGDIARIIGQRWGRLDPYSKEALDKLYQKDSLRYRREVEVARQKREQEMKEVAYPVSPTHQQQQQINQNNNNNKPYLPVTPMLEDHQRRHQYQREPPPPSALRAPSSPLLHQIPPSPTVASRRIVASASSLESELIQSDVWAKQRDQPALPGPAAAAMAVYPSDGLGEPYTLMTRRQHDVDAVDHRLQQQGQHRQFTRDHAMIMEYPHDGYDNNCSSASTTTTATSSSSPPALMRRQQLLEPNAIVPLRHPLTGVLEYYRVDYRAYQMTQSEARQFLRSYGCHNSSSNDGSYGSSSNEVQLEKILSLQLQPPGRPVSSS
jgi:HMG (high mobility group) box